MPENGPSGNVLAHWACPRHGGWTAAAGVCDAITDAGADCGRAKIEYVPLAHVLAENERLRACNDELWRALARAVDHDNACPDDGTCDLCRLRPEARSAR